MMKTTKKPKTSSTAASIAKTDAARTSSAKVDTSSAKSSVSQTNGPRAVTKPMPVAPAPKPDSQHILLEFVRPGAKSVCVAGSFNQWTPETTPLVPQGNDHWVGDLTVKPGRHEYLFVVDGQWVPDPNAKESVENPFGGRNSVLIVSE